MIFRRLRRACIALLTSDEPLKALDELAQAQRRMNTQAYKQAVADRYRATHQALAASQGKVWP